MSFGGFSSLPRKPNIYGDPSSSRLGPVENIVQGFMGTERGAQKPKVVLTDPVAKGPPALQKLDPQILWAGVIHGYSGYAKANREILKRAMKSIKTFFAYDSPWDSNEKDPDNLHLLRALRSVKVDDHAPMVTFLPPRGESKAGYRVIYTMMETEVVHSDMIRLMNEHYHECWVPTAWNAGTFKKSGLRIPIHVMPLGIDQNVYSPATQPIMPNALRLTGPTAGRYEVPSGFLFIYVCQPTFRKGIEVVIEAFAQAFAKDPEAGLIIASTAHSTSLFHPDQTITSRIWLLDEPFSEPELAGICRACKAYVCASRGEGWNLCMMEAAAVGIPVIVPRTSAHSDLVPENEGFFFSPDHKRIFPSAKEVSPWFDGIEFPDFGEKSHQELVRILQMVKSGYRSAMEVGQRYMKTVREKYTWDIAAANVVKRIKELCSGS